MTWFRVDDGFHSHSKALDASAEALRLWVLAGSWSGRHLTDGHIPTERLRTFNDNGRHVQRAARDLVEVGLWRPSEGGWVFHDWVEHQGYTAAEKRMQRENDRVRKRHLRAIQGGRSERHDALGGDE